MTRITSTTLARGILDDLAVAQRRLSATQAKLSSGKEITRPSDDPYAATRAITLRSQLEGAHQHERNVSEARGWQDVTDNALTGIADALQRTRELVVQAGSDASGPAARRAIAEELRGLVDTVKQEGNASYGGRYVFAGTSTETRPYTTGGTDAFAGDDVEISREIGPGVSVRVNALGREVVGDDDEGLLATMRTVIGHLEATPADGNALRGADLRALDGHLDALNATRATIGATTARLEAAAGRLGEYRLSITGLLSETEDADVAKSMVDFSIQQSALQAALRSGASIVQASLLDFLR